MAAHRVPFVPRGEVSLRAEIIPSVPDRVNARVGKPCLLLLHRCWAMRVLRPPGAPPLPWLGLQDSCRNHASPTMLNAVRFVLGLWLLICLAGFGARMHDTARSGTERMIQPKTEAAARSAIPVYLFNGHAKTLRDIASNKRLLEKRSAHRHQASTE